MVTRKRKRNPARRRRSVLFSNPTPTRRRRRRRTRRNAWYNDAAGHRKAARLGWRRRKGTVKKSSSRKGRRTRKNPVMTTSKYRRRYSRRRSNPTRVLTKAFSQQWLAQSATIAGGIVLGMLGMPLVYRVAPAQIKGANGRRFLGFAHVFMGALVAGFARNKTLKTLGIVIGGTGAYDLIAENTKQFLALPSLPITNPLFEGAAPAAPAAPDALPDETASASYMPQYQSASYMTRRRPVSSPAVGTVAASYEAPGSGTVGLGVDDPYRGIFA